MDKTLKPGSWKGLLLKEWMISKAEVITLLILNLVIGLGLPTIISKVFYIPADVSDGMHALVGLWLIAHMFIGLKLLFTSLRNEMKHPNIWLHSPWPIFQLVGVKAMFAAFFTSALLIVGGIMLAMSLTLNNVKSMPLLTGDVLVPLSILVATFLLSIYVMGIGFFFWSIYQVLRSRIGGISVVLVIILFFGCTYLLEKISFPGILDKIKTFGPVRFTDTHFYDETNHNLISIIVPDGVVFSVGGLLLYGGITAILFIVGSTLFEKKVRL